MAHVDLLNKLHKSTKRDYLARVLGGNKAEFATLAKKFDVEYWDAGRDTGYGGYHYDGRWRELAQTLISSYALDRAQPDVRPFLQLANATAIPFPDKSFDLVISLNTLHNLYIQDLYRGLQEIERVGKRSKYIVMDSYRNEQEKVNLLYWQLTCECFFTPAEWEFIFKQAGYTGDYGFIYFE